LRSSGFSIFFRSIPFSLLSKISWPFKKRPVDFSQTGFHYHITAHPANGLSDLSALDRKSTAASMSLFGRYF
jgi:hypothetical protein